MIKCPQKARRHNDDGEPILNYEKKKLSMKTRLPLTCLREKVQKHK